MLNNSENCFKQVQVLSALPPEIPLIKINFPGEDRVHLNLSVRLKADQCEFCAGRMTGGQDLETRGPTRWWLLIYVSFSALMNVIYCNKPNQFKITVGLQAPQNISYPFSLLRLGSAMQIAIDKINTNPSLSGNFTFDFVYVDTDCNAKSSLRLFIEQVMNQNVTALFGPPCPEEAEVSLMYCKYV